MPEPDAAAPAASEPASIAAVVKESLTTQSPPSAAHQTVWSWFNDHIANSPVSRATEAVNHLMATLPALVAALEKE